MQGKRAGGRLVCLPTPFSKRGFFHQEWTAGRGWARVKLTHDDLLVAVALACWIGEKKGGAVMLPFRLQ
jgi:hypothetical protein